MKQKNHSIGKYILLILLLISCTSNISTEINGKLFKVWIIKDYSFNRVSAYSKSDAIKFVSKKIIIEESFIESSILEGNKIRYQSILIDTIKNDIELNAIKLNSKSVILELTLINSEKNPIESFYFIPDENKLIYLVDGLYLIAY